MHKPEDFFIRDNIISETDKIDYRQTSDYLESIRAITRSIYSSIYIIDYQAQSFDYVSNNPLFLCGNTAEEVKEMGYEFYFRHVPKEDLELLLKINEAGFQFYHKLPIDDKKKYSLAYDFHLINSNDDKVLINQKITPLFLTEDFKVWKALCIITLSAAKSAGNVRIFCDGENIVHKYSLEGNYWKSYPRIILTTREKEILTLSARGLTIDQVSKELFVSPDTVKFHRKKVFNKLEVTNISEAIFFAINNKLI